MALTGWRSLGFPLVCRVLTRSHGEGVCEDLKARRGSRDGLEPTGCVRQLLLLLDADRSRLSLNLTF